MYGVWDRISVPFVIKLKWPNTCSSFVNCDSHVVWAFGVVLGSTMGIWWYSFICLPFLFFVGLIELCIIEWLMIIYWCVVSLILFLPFGLSCFTWHGFGTRKMGNLYVVGLRAWLVWCQKLACQHLANAKYWLVLGWLPCLLANLTKSCQLLATFDVAKCLLAKYWQQINYALSFLLNLNMEIPQHHCSNPR